MNLFLPYPNDLKKTAAFLDDGRLNKQVVEAFQIAGVILKLLRDPEAKPGWRNHPSTLLVWNGGDPKMPWLQEYIQALDDEWRARGFVRSEEFSRKIEALFQEAEEFAPRFSSDPVCAFVGGGEVRQGSEEEVGAWYRAYLEQKFENSKTRPRWTRPEARLASR